MSDIAFVIRRAVARTVSLALSVLSGVGSGPGESVPGRKATLYVLSASDLWSQQGRLLIDRLDVNPLDAYLGIRCGVGGSPSEPVLFVNERQIRIDRVEGTKWRLRAAGLEGLIVRVV